MNKNLQSPTQLTEFAPLSPEPEESPGITYLLTKLFKRGGNTTAEVKQGQSADGTPTSECLAASDTRWHDNAEYKEPHSDSSSQSGSSAPVPVGRGEPFRLDVTEGRSLPSVLKRISNLLALKSSGLQAYKDTELKQYWMPDSVSKECYDCGEKFTTFRRKHHCRVCGQIFCSRCCNQEIPGKIMGCTGDLRVCTYCGKVVLSYLQSADMGADLSSDLRALQEDLQVKFGGAESLLLSLHSSQASLSIPAAELDDSAKRKTSVGYQEERFIQARQYGREERSSPLQSLVCELSQASTGLGSNVFSASQLVDWLMLQNRASYRSQGVAIGQTLLETSYLESVSPETGVFLDNNVLFRLRTPSRVSPPPSSDELWPADLPLDSTTTGPDTRTLFVLLTDSEGECPASEASLPTSSSLFRLDLNLEDSTVHISRPPPSVNQPPTTRRSRSSTSVVREKEGEAGDPVVRAMVQSYRECSMEPANVVNWHTTPPHSLRVDNGERDAHQALREVFQQHLSGLVKQLLNSEGLAQSWAETVLPLAERVVDTVQPNTRSGTDDMDIRQYVQLKKVSGGSRSDCCIVGGVVCSKNLSHRAMAPRLANPRILLLSCAIVYQRIEGRLMSLEPVMMQEQEYLRHTVARIAAMAPDLVLVQRNVSRLAQESLLRLGISLALNVRPSVLERVSRITGADVIKSIDATVGRPTLGTCASFHLKTFTSDNGVSKTLMFFEGCSSPHLGCTVLLRGAPVTELSKLKRVTKWLIYALYNWRLEHSFLMDEFALPPLHVDVNFFKDDLSPEKSKSETMPLSGNSVNSYLPSEAYNKSKLENENFLSSPSAKKIKNSDKENKSLEELSSEHSACEFEKQTMVCSKDKLASSEEKRINVESISDFSDPLHLYMNLEDEVFSETGTAQSLSVAEPSQSNRFRKALDDTLLSVSPFIKFSVPHLETEVGRNCLLRGFFPENVYWSAQLSDEMAPVHRPSTTEAPPTKEALLKLSGVKLKPVHPFVTARLTEPASSHEVQTLLALYRACGGRLPPATHSPAPPIPPVTPAPSPAAPSDVLDPSNHQRLAVLFCSYSHESINAPDFCVNPWVFHMDFYGRNDIPLGAFLERYCFRSSHFCQSERCNAPMLKHVRRFVHDGGAVQISLQEIENAPHTDDDSILMWTYCSACDQQVSQVMRMSPDSWSFSFAKYLELHFHAPQYSIRGSQCCHSLHQHCRQFFGHKNMVAYFQYDKISVWEISLPPSLLVMQAVTRLTHQEAILEEVKLWALNGYEVFSAILNRLCTLVSNGDSAMMMKQQLQKEQALFKSRVEEIQMRLTSPSHSANSVKGPRLSVWHMEDSLVLLKRSIAEAVAEWNVRLTEAESAYQVRRREERRQKTQPPQNSATSLSEIVDGMVSPQGYEADGLRKSLTSQTSQSSLISAAEVMDVDDSHDIVADDTTFDTDYLDNEAADCEPLLEESPVTSIFPAPGRTKSNVADETVEQMLLDSEVHLVEEDVSGKDSHKLSDKHQPADRVTMKHILSQLLPKDHHSNNLQCPLSPQEHHTLPLGTSVPVVVYEREPSSIIAYAISCHDYHSGLEEMRAKHTSTTEQPSPSPLMKRKSGNLEVKDSTAMADPSSASDSGKAGVLSFLRTSSNSGTLGSAAPSPGEGAATTADSEEPVKTDTEPTKTKASREKPSPHLEVQFSDSTANFIVKIYYAEEFAQLRAKIFPAGEEAFVRSLSRCVQWAARGGKSGSNFAKTKDDRFILKEMSRTETHPFMDSAPQYFDYMDKCAAAGLPTLLGKIVGVFRVIYRSSTSNTTFRSNLLVMENLFYGRSVKHKFDLKGSVRNRLVNPLEQGGEIVLLDENLINMTCDNPLYILPHSKTVLMQAIQADTQFLASQSVMDYSLLVGLDENSKELVVGIIDYIRTFTWDKKLETMVKRSGLLGGQGKLPTIVSPDEYRARFNSAMNRYFLPVPDRWTGLGKGLNF